MLGIGLAAIDSTILATAIPQMLGDLGGFSKCPWLFSTPPARAGVFVPIFGRLSDVFGRKPVLLFGVGVFLVGSVLCGLACVPFLASAGLSVRGAPDGKSGLISAQRIEQSIRR